MNLGAVTCGGMMSARRQRYGNTTSLQTVYLRTRQEATQHATSHVGAHALGCRVDLVDDCLRSLCKQQSTKEFIHIRVTQECTGGVCGGVLPAGGCGLLVGAGGVCGGVLPAGGCGLLVGQCPS